ncbi:MAG TPA: hypothetical protein VJ279_13430, partial [Hanamia sp.]|nr:hypothetical protein [Hanamia sp.]
MKKEKKNEQLKTNTLPLERLREAQIKIRKAIQEDCPSMMQLIHELAVYEKAPQEVTVDFDHFVESG